MNFLCIYLFEFSGPNRHQIPSSLSLALSDTVPYPVELMARWMPQGFWRHAGCKWCSENRGIDNLIISGCKYSELWARGLQIHLWHKLKPFWPRLRNNAASPNKISGQTAKPNIKPAWICDGPGKPARLAEGAGYISNIPWSLHTTHSIFENITHICSNMFV